MNLMVDFVLSGYAVVAVGLCHINLEDNIIAASSFCDLWRFSRKNFSRTVLPIHIRFWRSTLNVTLQQRPVLCLFNYCEGCLWRCTCETVAETLSYKSITGLDIYYYILLDSILGYFCSILWPYMGITVYLRQKHRGTNRNTKAQFKYWLHIPL